MTNPNNYYVRDGTGNTIAIKSTQIPDPDYGFIQVPQSIPSDQTGLPYSASNPLPVVMPAASQANNIGSIADIVDATGNGSVIAQTKNIWTYLKNIITVKLQGNPVTWTDYSGTVTSTNVAQDVVPANPSRKGFIITNLDTSNFLFINFTGTASLSAGSIPIGPYSTFEMSPHTLAMTRVSVMGNAGMVFTVKEAT